MQLNSNARCFRLQLLLCSIVAVSGQESELRFKTLPHGLRSMPKSDALLTDWEGQHWVSLDADEDKVALSWTADKEYITFQVKRHLSYRFIVLPKPEQTPQSSLIPTSHI